MSITNSGGGKLDWTVTFGNGTPSYISISPTSGSGLPGGATAFISVTVNTSALPAGAYNSIMTISAVDSATGQPVAGSPSYVIVNISITSSRSLLSPTPSPVLCPTPSPTPTPTPETGLGFAPK